MIKSASTVFLAVLAVSVGASSALPSVSRERESNDVRGDMSQLVDSDGNVVGLINDRKLANDDTELDNKLLSYEPMMNKVKYPALEAYLSELEKGKVEPTSGSSPVKVVVQKETTIPTVLNQEKVETVARSTPVVKSAASNLSPADAEREERMKLIAHNSREVRLVGPDGREVEMKDDAATRMAVAIDNLRKEATEVWGQVNTKLDKGWTDFKSMVEDAVESAKKKAGPTIKQSSASASSTMDEIAAAADSTVKTIKDQAEVAGTKIKGFFNNLGVNV